MSEIPKQQFPRYPFNFPPYFQGLNPDHLKHLQANYPRGNIPLPPPPGLAMPNGPFTNPRLYEHFANSYRTSIMPPPWSYNPYARPPINPSISMQMKNERDPEEKPIIQTSTRSFPNMGDRVIEIQKEFAGKKFREEKQAKKIRVIPEKAPLKASEVEVRKNAIPIRAVQVENVSKNNKQKKPKPARIPSILKYQPTGGKKKQKKDFVITEVPTHRQTREKKQTIQKIMMMVMRDRPKRERVMKIGKDHQAVIPESFTNEYQYQLKLKMEKKQELMARLFTPQPIEA